MRSRKASSQEACLWKERKGRKERKCKRGMKKRKRLRVDRSSCFFKENRKKREDGDGLKIE